MFSGKKIKKRLFTALFCFFLLTSARAQYLFDDPVYLMDRNIEKAEELVSAKKTEEAVTLLLELFPKAVNNEQKTQVEFLLGMASMQKRDFATAEWIFRRILRNQPSLARVRLELALLYFETGRNEKADYHFRLVWASRDLPLEVKQKIGYFLYQIRYRKRWDYYLNLGIAPTNNINNVSGAHIECIEVDFGGWIIPMCRELEKKRSSVGLSGYAGIENYLRLNRSLRLKSTLSGGISDFAGSEFDIYSLSFSTGPLYNFKRGSAGAYASAERVWYGGKGFLNSYGPIADFSYDLTRRLGIGLSGALKKNEYERDTHKHFDGHSVLVMPSLYIGINSKTYVILKPSANFIRTENRWTDRDVYRYGVGLGTELPLGISLYAEPFYSYSKTKRGWVQDFSYEIKKRIEDSYGIDVRLLNRQINILGFTPTFNYSFNKTTSNIRNGGFEKHTFELGITNRF